MRAPSAGAPLHPQDLPALQLPLQPEGLFAFLAQLALGALGRQLALRVGGLELVDGGEEGGDLVAGLGNVLGQGGVLLLAALDLRFQVFDRAVDGADAAGFVGFPGRGGFELLFELRGRGGMLMVWLEWIVGEREGC